MTKRIPIDKLIHYGIPGMHWGDRRYQYEDGRLTPEGKLRYMNAARFVASENLVKTVGTSSTLRKQQNRYLKWARANVSRGLNQNKELRGEFANKEILARKNEAKNYGKALRLTFKTMKEYSNEGIPQNFYNEDYIVKAFNDVYRDAVIEPAWRRFDKAIEFARNAEGSEDFINFTSNKSKMKRYGYTEEASIDAEDIGITNEQLAYMEYLLAKDKVN